VTDRIEAATQRIFQPGTRWTRAAVALVLLLAGLHASGHVVWVSMMSGDVFIPLDAGWRWVHGQMPHVDYHTPIGFLYAAAYGEAMHLLGPHPRALLVVPALAAVATALLAARLGRGRLPDALLGCVVLALSVQITSPLHLDLAGLAHLGSYNRFAGAVVGVVLLWAWTEGPRSRVDVALVAGLLWVLVFVKVTYAMLAGAGLALGFAAVPGVRRDVAAAAAAGSLAVAATFAVWDLPWRYLDDIRAAAASWDPAVMVHNDRTPGLLKAVSVVLANVPPLLGVLGGCWWWSRASPPDRQPTRGVAIAVGGTALMGAVSLQTHDHYTPALAVPLALTVLGARATPGAVTTAVAWIAVGWMAYRASWEGMGVVIHRFADPEGAVAARTNGPGVDLRIVGMPPEGASSRVALVEDGVITLEQLDRVGAVYDEADFVDQMRAGDALAEELVGPRAGVLAAWFSQPYAWLRGTPPPRGLLSWYHPGRTFGGLNPLGADHLREVDVVLLPKTYGGPFPEGDVIVDQLGPALVGWRREERPLWTAWVRP
jgi:hypothetical protein